MTDPPSASSGSTEPVSVGVRLRVPNPAHRQDLDARTLAAFRRAANADLVTRDALLADIVHDHLWLADSIARRYRHRGEEDDDLLQVARAGLFEACLRFDSDAGAFCAFASATVSGLLKRHFRDHTWTIRPPRRTQELSVQLWHQWPDLVQAARSEPSNRQIAELVGVRVDDVREAREARRAYRAESLNADLDHTAEHGDRDREQSEAHLVVASAWPQLSEKEQRLLVMRFYEERRQTDIAAELGVSQMQVSRLLDRLMTKLRRIIGPLHEPSTAA